MAGIVVLAIAAVSARSVALAGFGLDSLIEIAASTVVIWELSGTGAERQRRGLRLIGYAFAALAVYLLAPSTGVLAAGYQPGHSMPGIIWTTATAGAMFTLAVGKVRSGQALGNPVLADRGPGHDDRTGSSSRSRHRVRPGALRCPRGPGDRLRR